MKTIKGGVAAPQGFTASGLACGIKKTGKKDLSLIYSEVPCTAAGVFTTNKVQASCVVINQKNLKIGMAQAILANSGNANCMTGKPGFRDSERMAATIGTALHIAKQNVLVASTGVIGKPLPIEKIVGAAPELVKKLGKMGAKDAAQGILTTDHTVKEVAAEVMIGGVAVKIGAIAKGAGMIHPQMALSSSAQGFGGTKHATMLCFVTTDASIAPAALRTALDEATQNTFNMITIDGDMSTNDMVLVLANGMAGNKKIAAGSKESTIFSKALSALFLTLAKLMVRDAEGATKFVEVTVRGAKSGNDARVAARAVASSNLVKCALFGSDPNWGRIAAAIGQSAAHVDPWKMKIYLGKELVLQKGGKVDKKAALLDKVFAQKNIQISVDLGLGTASATAYTCDLSLAYVQLNSAYRT